MTSMDNTPDSPANSPDNYTTQGGNFWTLITPEIWKVLHAVLQATWHGEAEHCAHGEFEYCLKWRGEVVHADGNGNKPTE
jgi:hypothetical protein